MIYSGKADGISWAKGTWLILDLGFSSRKKSCCILLGDEKATKLTFNDAVNEVIRVANSLPLVNLVIEAPLSVAFDKSGNPKVRKADKKDQQSRPWYYGPGCAMMVAAMYLMRKLYDSCPSGEVILFEGFVSFKDEGKRSSDLEDVKYLRDAIKGEGTRIARFYKPEDLKEDPDDNIKSAFEVMYMKDMDFGIPPVIRV